MRRAALLAITLGAAVGALASSAGARTPTKPSAKYCDAFEDYHLIVGISYFSHGSGWEDEFGLVEIAPKHREPVMALIWSPRLEADTKTMATAGPKATRKAWRAAADAAGDGVTTLEDSLGLDDELVALLRDLDPADPDIEEFGTAADDAGISPQEFERDVVDAAGDFEPRMRDLGLGGASRQAISAVRAAGQECGVLTTRPSPG